MKKKRLIADLLLLLFLLLLSFTLFLLLNKGEDGKCAELTVGGVSTTLYLGEDQAHTVEGKNGITLVVRVENGEIFVESATCKDKLCQHRGRLKKSGDVAVCLPAEVSIRVLGESEVDAYA
jgi:hypothetical protein